MDRTRMTLQLQLANMDSPLVNEAARLLMQELAERAGVEVVRTTEAADLTLRIDPDTDTEGYRIENVDSILCITGNDPPGLLYGVGRFLHSSISGDGGFEPGAWRGSSAPACNFRGMYFAHNFHNWYRSAPLPDLVRYVEDLALWGLNAIVFPCDTNPPCPVDEIESIMLPKQLELIIVAKRLGIRIGMITAINTILTTPEAEIAAEPVPDAKPVRRGQAGNRVCPSHPKGFARLTSRFERSLDAYTSVGLDFVVGFPYDEGGCGCEQCRPWGGNGYIKACMELSRLAKQKYSGCHFIAGTWCFDVLDKPEGEYEGLDRSIRLDAGWCDGVMCDSHGEYPKWPIEHGAPSGLPMINFAEISMWGRRPWGGCGANPLPRRIADIWRQSRHLLSGGLPYSEGRFEDINKVTCLSLFWDKDADLDKVVREYIGYEFGTVVVEKMAAAIRIMEETYRPQLRTHEKAKTVIDLVQEAAAKLPSRVLSSWRWRLLFLRAIIDLEATTHANATGIVSDRQNDAFKELVNLYCAENAQPSVTPPTRSGCALDTSFNLRSHYTAHDRTTLQSRSRGRAPSQTDAPDIDKKSFSPLFLSLRLTHVPDDHAAVYAGGTRPDDACAGAAGCMRLRGWRAFGGSALLQASAPGCQYRR